MRTDYFTRTVADAEAFERRYGPDYSDYDDKPSLADVAGLDRPSRSLTRDETAASLLGMWLRADYPDAHVHIEREHVLAITGIPADAIDEVATKTATSPAVMDPWSVPSTPADTKVVEGVLWVRFHPVTLDPSEVPF